MTDYYGTTNYMKKFLDEKQNKLHFTLIDPDKQSPEKAKELAKIFEDYGTDAIMVGGSTVDNETTDRVTNAVKESVKIPIILFPNAREGISKSADYIFFMSLLNSRSRKYLVEEQLKGAMIVKKFGIKVIPMGYIVISTSKKPTTVERN
jgi:phosphoglycerol geranylgeranyltransferase